MKTILSIEEGNKKVRIVAVVDIDRYNIERKIQFIASVLNVIIIINDYEKLIKELERNKTISVSNLNEEIKLIFNEITEY